MPSTRAGTGWVVVTSPPLPRRNHAGSLVHDCPGPQTYSEKSPRQVMAPDACSAHTRRPDPRIDTTSRPNASIRLSPAALESPNLAQHQTEPSRFSAQGVSPTTASTTSVPSPWIGQGPETSLEEASGSYQHHRLPSKRRMQCALPWV